jgi:hypothetical protein
MWACTTFLVGKCKEKGPHSKLKHKCTDDIHLGTTECIGVSELASTAPGQGSKTGFCKHNSKRSHFMI